MCSSHPETNQLANQRPQQQNNTATIALLKEWVERYLCEVNGELKQFQIHFLSVLRNLCFPNPLMIQISSTGILDVCETIDPVFHDFPKVYDHDVWSSYSKPVISTPKGVTRIKLLLFI